MGHPEWIQTYNPQLTKPQPWDPTLMERFSTLHSVALSKDHLIPPLPHPSSPPPPPPLSPHPPPSHQNGADDETNKHNDSDTEMSLSPVSDAPIIHLSDEARDSPHDPNGGIHEDIDIPGLKVPIFNWPSDVPPLDSSLQFSQSSNTTESTDLNCSDLISLNRQPITNAINESNSIMTPSPKDPSLEKTTAQAFKNNNSSIEFFTADTSTEAIDTILAESQKLRSISDDTAPSDSFNDKQSQAIEKLINRSLSEMAFAAERTTRINTDDTYQRRIKAIKNKAYFDGVEAGKKFFTPGAKDCIINGNTVAENPHGRRNREPWKEVYRPEYRPWEARRFEQKPEK